MASCTTTGLVVRPVPGRLVRGPQRRPGLGSPAPARSAGGRLGRRPPTGRPLLARPGAQLSGPGRPGADAGVDPARRAPGLAAALAPAGDRLPGRFRADLRHDRPAQAVVLPGRPALASAHPG